MFSKKTHNVIVKKYFNNLFNVIALFNFIALLLYYMQKREGLIIAIIASIQFYTLIVPIKYKHKQWNQYTIIYTFLLGASIYLHSPTQNILCLCFGSYSIGNIICHAQNTLQFLRIMHLATLSLLHYEYNGDILVLLPCLLYTSPSPRDS